MPDRITAFPWLLLAVLVPTVVPSAVAQQLAPWPVDRWSRATPDERGLDGTRLAGLATEIRTGRITDLHGLLVVRHGYLVFEEYFDGYGADDVHMQQSVSKSFTSALIGIAIDRGDLGSVDDRVVDFFPERAARTTDPRRRAMRLEDLLTMRSGTDYHERGSRSPHAQLNRLARGWDDFVLDRPMQREPGTFFQYDSGGVILLSSILKTRTGMHADDYARRFLFGPLGIERANWFENAEGHPHTGGGLSLRPRDMARFGLLYLRRGEWNGARVVSTRWVDQSFRTHVQFDSPRGNRAVGYGYLWWLLPPSPSGQGTQPVFAAMGFRGQFIFVIPEHDMVVTVTAGTTTYADEIRPIQFLYSHILPAVRP